jgi:hypothetical protein
MQVFSGIHQLITVDVGACRCPKQSLSTTNCTVSFSIALFAAYHSLTRERVLARCA